VGTNPNSRRGHISAPITLVGMDSHTLTAGNRRTVITIVSVAALLALITVGAYQFAPTSPPTTSTAAIGDAPPTLTITGTIFLKDEYNRNYKIGQICHVTNRGFEDIRQGAQVLIIDNTGTNLAVGNLNAGAVVADPLFTPEFGGGTCQFAFRISNIPTGRGPYGITVSHRGTLTYTEPQLAGTIELTLG
jgi:hypothetical protein